jgi:2-(1,2-epoxy-1,2-dihydrophenyl)acetyl-CoA isomerase
MTLPQPGEHLRVSVAEGVAELTLDRPDARNALSVRLRDDLLAAVRACRASDDVRAVLLAGSGGVFCSGMDLRESTAARAGEPGFDAREMEHALHSGVHALVRELWELDKPVVAAVDGAAVGPGAHLALACDLVVVGPATTLSWSFSRIGLVVDAAGAYLLPRLVGLPRAKALVLLSESLSGEDCVREGLAYRCADDVLGTARELAASLAAGPTRALGLSKRLLNATFERDLATSLELEAAYQALATRSADLVEGLAAFREKRRPDFTGH